MNEKGKIAKIEWLLLASTALFLCILMALYFRDRAAMERGAVETDVQVPQEELVPKPLPPVDLNTATAEELTALPGIGEELAGRIVAYREEHGPFETPEEVMNVSGIGESKFAGLKEHITVNGEETS